MIDNITLMHEHIHLDLSGVKNNPDCLFNDYEALVDEMTALKKYGVRRVVDVTNIGIGRDVQYVQRVQQETGLEIVSSTGFYKEPFFPAVLVDSSPRELASIMINEIVEGIRDEEGVIRRQAQVIGEIGSSKDVITPMEKKVFEAAAIASVETGAPITTHTTLGTCGLEQLELLSSYGVDLSKVIIGHVDLSGDLGYVRKLVEQGANVQIDTIGKEHYQSDDLRVRMVADLVEAGYQDQLFLSMDLTRKSHLAAHGGIGYLYLFEQFLPRLIKAGIKQEDLDAILTKNPNRILGDL